MFQFTGSFRHARRAALCGAAALSLAVGCPPAGRSQPVASGDPTAGALPLSPQQIMASIRSPTDITPIRDGVRSGTLFRSTTSVSEEALRHKEGTQTEASFTVPLMIDRVQNRLSVQALVNNRKVRLILDTGAMPVISLNQTTAQGMDLAGEVSIQRVGAQGYEPAILGLAKSLTLGKLTLQQIPVSVGGSNPFYDCTLGLSAFEHYRVTLDFAAKTMTLTRGGAPVAPSKAGASLAVLFEGENGYLFVPVQVLNKEGWALLDSGADANLLSFEAATSAAAQLAISDTKTGVLDQKVGAGNTARKFKMIGLKVPVPISMNTAARDVCFNTTSQFGTSVIDEVLDASFSAHTHIAAQLGFPFLLQFQRVTIDYPSHALILQYPAHNNFVKVTLAPTDHDKPWPGYKWRQKGYAWIEVPDLKTTSAPSLPAANPQGSATNVIKTTTKVTTVFTSSDGGTTVTINGTKIACPPGSTVQVGADGVVHILPPGGSTAQ